MSVGSTVVNTIAANKVAKARDEALAAERIRQRGLDQEADALNLTSQDRYQGIEGKQDERASELGQYFTEQQIENDTGNAAVAEEMAVPQSSSNITVREEEKQRAKANAFSENQGQALGNLRAFGDLLGGIGRAQARDAGAIGQIGGFKRGSSGIVPLELDEASHAGDGMKLFGDLLGLGGSFALNGGLSGSSLFGGFGRTSLPRTAPVPTPRPVGGNLVRLY